MKTRITKRSQIFGCILGGALGDAWGGPWENKPGPIVFEVPSRSSISDDTQFTLATCESIIEDGCVHPEHLALKFADRFTARRITGLGSSTLKAMNDLVAGVHCALAGSRGEYSAGNGAAMRIAPLAFLLDPADPADGTTIRDGASGYVVDTVPLALYCAQFIAHQSLSAVDAQAVRVGGDTDTIASITGQVAGTVVGAPTDYREHFSRITGGDEVTRMAERFADFVSTQATD